MTTIRRLSSISSVLAASVLATAAEPPPAAPATAPEAKPLNVVLIVADDLNDWIGCMGGHPLVRTPNIDRLASKGMLFTNAHCPSPMSAPSRTAMLTAERNWRDRFPMDDPTAYRQYSNGQIVLRDIFPDTVTLPEWFRTNGYATLCAGKVFHPKYDARSWDQRFAIDETPQFGASVHGIEEIPFDWRFTDAPRDQFPMYKEVSWACEKLGTPHEKPFFMGVGISAPHLPWYLPRAFDDVLRRPADKLPAPRLEGDLGDVPAEGRKLAYYRKADASLRANGLDDDATAAYIAMVEFADSQVGRLLRSIETGPHRSNTVVMFTSDHGFHLGEKGHWTKGTLWEESTRVPLIVAAPEMATAGSTCARPVTTQDIYATAADIAGIPANPVADSKSLRPLLEDPKAPWDEAVVSSLGPERHAVRSERWRYIIHYDGSEELYDHDVDPNEWTNVASVPENAGVLEDLRRHVPPSERLPMIGRKKPKGEEALRGKWNVLFLAMDDLNDWVGCMGGHPDAKTPNIDRLAQRGMLFTRAFAPGAICGPSRAAILSGYHPSASGVWEWYDIDMRRAFSGMGMTTLPERFVLNGYDALGTGKVFHYPNDERSWTKYFHTGGYPQPEPMPGMGIEMETPFIEFDWGAVDRPEGEFVDVRHATWAIERLSEPREKPFFLAFGCIKPHLPWHVPRKYFEMHPLEEIDLPETIPGDLEDVPQRGRGFAIAQGEHKRIVDAGKWREGVQAYLAAASYADDLVGRIVEAVDRSPMADRTVIVLWSDHGQHLGEKEHWKKLTPWEETARVPFIVCVPGMATAGRTCDRVVSLQDIYPTLMDLCKLGGKLPPSGRSVVPLLADPSLPWDHPALTSIDPAVHGIRSERWRFVTYGPGQEELYDHDADPNEWHNVAADPANAAVIESFRRMIPPPVPVRAATPVPAAQPDQAP